LDLLLFQRQNPAVSGVVTEEELKARPISSFLYQPDLKKLPLKQGTSIQNNPLLNFRKSLVTKKWEVICYHGPSCLWNLKNWFTIAKI
jgi:hypothetical protein